MKIIIETLKFDINVLNKNFCEAQDAKDTDGFRALTEMPTSLMVHLSLNK